MLNTECQSRRSWGLALATGISQPTVSKTIRSVFEKGMIDSRTMLPKLGKMGFEIAVLTLIKHRPEGKKKEELENTRKKLREWFLKQPKVIAAAEGSGMGQTLFCASVHQSYADYSEFARKLEVEIPVFLLDSEAFIIDLKRGEAVKPFHFKYLKL